MSEEITLNCTNNYIHYILCTNLLEKASPLVNKWKHLAVDRHKQLVLLHKLQTKILIYTVRLMHHSVRRIKMEANSWRASILHNKLWISPIIIQLPLSHIRLLMPAVIAEVSPKSSNNKHDMTTC